MEPEHTGTPAVGPTGRPPCLLLTGRPGAGKTTVIQRVVERIDGERCAGFYTRELRERGRRIGFDVVTLDGRRGPLARLGGPGPRVGRYGVDVAAFEALGVSALVAALERGAGVVVVDEIGKMELLSERFVEVLEQLFDEARTWIVLGTVLRGRHVWVDQLRRRPDVRVLEVTPANREALPVSLAALCLDFLTWKEAGGGGRGQAQKS